MAKRTANMKRLLEERDRLAAEIEALKHRLAGLNHAIELLSGEPIPHASAGDRRRGNVKSTVLGLMQEFSTNGLSASETVEIAARRGIQLDRASVSSLLSRLKREGTLTYDGAKYRPANKKEVAASEDAQEDAGNDPKRFNVVQ
jgi:hypothetical protein